MTERTTPEGEKPVTFANPKLPLAVIVAATRWDEPPRMRHHISWQLMRFCNVLFVEFDPLRKGSEGGVFIESNRLVIFRPVGMGRIPMHLYANDPFTHHVVNRIVVNRISGVVGAMESTVKILFNFVYHFPEIMAEGDYACRIYVCFDEFPRMWRRRNPGNRLNRWYQERLYQGYEKRVVRRSDLCLTPHALLRDKLQGFGANVEMFYHAHTANVGDQQSTKDRKRGMRDGITVAFMGFIHYRLLDDWLLAVLPEEDLELSLIGPVNPRYDMKQFDGFRNFRWFPPVGERELGGVLADMDVLVMPYDRNLPEVEVLTTTSKLYQYISSRKPIVISDLPHFIEMPPGVIYRAKDAEDFVAKIRQACAEDCDEFRETRRRIAAENTWDKRGEQLHGLLKTALGNAIPELQG